MALNDTPENHRAESTTPLAHALAQQAKAQIVDLAKARGLGSDTFATLEKRAGELIDRIGEADADAVEAVRDHRGVLRSVARLLADPTAREIPPSNDAIYAAVLDVTELHAIVSSLGGGGVPIGRLLAHLSVEDAGVARRDRLSISFAAVCKRAGLGVKVGSEPGGVVEIALDRWSIAAAAAVPLGQDGMIAAAVDAERRLRDSGRPGLIVLECGALLGAGPIRVADDETAVGVMNEQLDAFMIDAHDGIVGALGEGAHAFGLVVHATLSATNVASRRLLFAECLRAVNLCDADDPRINGFQAFIGALARAEKR